MSTNFHVGQKVTLADANNSGRGVSRQEGESNGARYPVKGHVYTIRQINHWSSGTAILLEEIDNSHLIGWKGFSIEPGFPAERFRPVVTKTTDISVFKAILENPKQPISA